MERIKEYKKITIKDYSSYEPEKCSDGGAYGFWTEYLYKGGDIWEISYGTTADMEFCPCCGSFNSHYDYENEEYSCGDFDTINLVFIYKGQIKIGLLLVLNKNGL